MNGDVIIAAVGPTLAGVALLIGQYRAARQRERDHKESNEKLDGIHSIVNSRLDTALAEVRAGNQLNKLNAATMESQGATIASLREKLETLTAEILKRKGR